MFSPVKNWRSLNFPSSPFNSIDVLLKSLNLVFLIIALQVSNHPLHVVLQIVHVVSLLAKSSLDKPVVKNEINSRFNSFFSALSTLFCTCIGSNIKVIANLSCDMLSSHLIQTILNQFDGVCVGEKLIT